MNSKYNTEEPVCGMVLGCRQPGEIALVARDQGGHFGYVCADHADNLNGYLERMSEMNARLMADGHVDTNEIPRLLRAEEL